MSYRDMYMYFSALIYLSIHLTNRAHALNDSKLTFLIIQKGNIHVEIYRGSVTAAPQWEHCLQISHISITLHKNPVSTRR